MNNKILITLLLTLNANLLYAEELASILRGKIVAKNLSELQVTITESDGSILDMTDISANGTYNLDLTIMDTPSQIEVKKLIVEVKRKSGKKELFDVKQYLNVFADTVILNPIVLQ